MWLVNEQTGKRAPIESAPDERGNILVNLERGTYRILPADEHEAHRGWLHLNHFATCPQAKDWARYGKRAAR